MDELSNEWIPWHWHPWHKVFFCLYSFVWFTLFFRGFLFVFLLFSSQWHPYYWPCPCLLPCFWSFCFLVGFYGVIFQPHKCLAWALFGLFLNFVPHVEFYYLLGVIKILGVRLGFTSLAFFFVRGFRRRCLTCRCVLRFRGHLGGFGYLLLRFA